MTKKPTDNNTYDIIIVGGGPAGLSAALILGRCCRKVLVFDTGQQRNRLSKSLNGFITRDGINPKEFLAIARKELAEYGTEFRNHEVLHSGFEEGLFWVVDDSGNIFYCRKILLATGLRDNIPEIQGIGKYYGKSVHHCAYCDGWGSRGKRIAVFGPLKHGAKLALVMRNWSSNVILLTGGGEKPSRGMMQKLKAAGVPVYYNRIISLIGKEDHLTGLQLDNGEIHACDKLFFGTGYQSQSDLGRQLGCEYTTKNEIKVNHTQESSVPGVFVSGDAAYEMKLVIIAAGEGAKAAVAINNQIMEEDRQKDVFISGEKP